MENQISILLLGGQILVSHKNKGGRLDLREKLTSIILDILGDIGQMRELLSGLLATLPRLLDSHIDSTFLHTLKVAMGTLLLVLRSKFNNSTEALQGQDIAQDTAHAGPIDAVDCAVARKPHAPDHVEVLSRRIQDIKLIDIPRPKSIFSVQQRPTNPNRYSSLDEFIEHSLNLEAEFRSTSSLVGTHFHAESGNWFLSRCATFLDDDRSRLLLLQGREGLGKTFLLERLRGVLLDHQSKDAIFVTYSYDSEAPASFAGILGSFVSQVIQTAPPRTSERLRNTLLEVADSKPQFSDSDLLRLFGEILEKAAKRSTITFVLDGLDEAEDQVSSAVFSMIARACTVSLRIKCIFASRTYRNLQLEGSSTEMQVIDLYEETNQKNDLSVFISSELRTILQSCRPTAKLTQNRIEIYEEMLKRKSNGSFLWASLALVNISQWATSDPSFNIGEKINEIPASSDMRQFYDYLLSNTPRNLKGLAKSTFSWCLGAVKNLDKRELVEALALNENPSVPPVTDNQTLQTCLTKIQRATASLVSLNADHVGFIHPTFREYLLDPRSRHRISLSDADEVIAVSSLNYLAKGDLEKDLHSTIPRQSIRKYQTKFLLTHYNRAESHGKSLVGFLFNFVENFRSPFKNWAAEYLKSRRSTLPKVVLEESLLICATFGFLQLTKVLLDMGRDANVSFEGATPIDVAAANGYAELSLLLLQAGAKISCSIAPAQTLAALANNCNICSLNNSYG